MQVKLQSLRLSLSRSQFRIEKKNDKQDKKNLSLIQSSHMPLVFGSENLKQRERGEEP